MSAPGYTYGGEMDAGAVGIVTAADSGSIRIADLGLVFVGIGAASVSVVSLDDQDGDGYEEVAIGAPGSSYGGARRGAVYVYEAPLTGTIDPTAAATVYRGVSDDLQIGAELEIAGDVDGDGLDDLLIRDMGIYMDDQHGSVWLISGEAFLP